MASMMEQLMQQLGGDTMKQISGMLGAQPQQAEQATGAALTALLGGLSRNAGSRHGADALSRALEKDHDGSVLDDLSSKLPELRQGPGEGILRHVLGAKRSRVEQGIGQTTGLDRGSVGQLLTMLAPIVLGALGKKQREQRLDAGALAGLLGQERREIERRQPDAAGMVGRMLDTDGDGDVDLSDIVKHGSGLLGKLFRS